MTLFPTTLDSAITSSASDYLSTGPHSTLHNNLEDRTIALETKVGADGSAVTTTHDYKLSGVSGTDKAASKTGTETLTNKTLTTPVIASLYQDAGKTKLMTLPDTASDTIVTLAATQTLTGKTLTTPTIGDLTNATHDHSSAVEGGSINLGLAGYWNAVSWATVSVTDVDTLDFATLVSPQTFPSGGGEYNGPASMLLVGDRLKLTNDSATKYFYVTAVNTSTGVVDLFGGTNYALVGTGTLKVSDMYMARTHADGFPEWMEFTPSWTNLTVGTGDSINTGYLCMVGKTVHFRVRAKLGSSGSSIGGPVTLTLPITAATYGNLTTIGKAIIRDAGTAYFGGVVTSSGNVWVGNAGGTYEAYNELSSSVPMTWTGTDELMISGTYQAA